MLWIMEYPGALLSTKRVFFTFKRFHVREASAGLGSDLDMYG